MDPLVFEPYFRPQVWGARRLEEVLRKRLPPDGPFGESWEISGHPLHVSRVAEGPHRGAGLDELWARFAADWTGSLAPPPRFPWLLKFLDCDELLSVQVHPDDAAAARLLPGESGKTEAWLVLHADPDAQIYAGLLPGVTRADLERHLDAGTVGQCLHAFRPQPGDFLFLPAGTVHAAGGGLVFLEIQQSSDATFRLFDWNRLGTDGRARALHRAEALECIDWSAGPLAPLRTNDTRLAACTHFTVSRHRLSGTLEIPGHSRMSLWAVVSGQAELSAPAGSYRRAFGRGETVLVPGNPAAFQWNALRATLLSVE